MAFAGRVVRIHQVSGGDRRYELFVPGGLQDIPVILPRISPDHRNRLGPLLRETEA